jgi:hypothetical protein
LYVEDEEPLVIVVVVKSFSAELMPGLSMIIVGIVNLVTYKEEEAFDGLWKLFFEVHGQSPWIQN